MGQLKQVDKGSFESEVMQSDVPVMVDFFADWCGPCKALNPKLEEIAEENAGKVKVVKVNVDQNPELASQFGVRGIPTIVYFKGGQVVNQITGLVEKAALLEPLQIA